MVCLPFCKAGGEKSTKAETTKQKSPSDKLNKQESHEETQVETQTNQQRLMRKQA